MISKSLVYECMLDCFGKSPGIWGPLWGLYGYRIGPHRHDGKKSKDAGIWALRVLKIRGTFLRVPIVRSIGRWGPPYVCKLSYSVYSVDPQPSSLSPPKPRLAKDLPCRSCACGARQRQSGSVASVAVVTQRLAHWRCGHLGFKAR